MGEIRSRTICPDRGAERVATGEHKRRYGVQTVHGCHEAVRADSLIYPSEITRTIADVLHEHDIRPDQVLENRSDADIMTFEKDLMTGKILEHLHPGKKVRVQGFEKIEKPFMNHFDLAISNIPFVDVTVFVPEFSSSKDSARHSAARTIHNYFFLKSLDAVREGEIVVFITLQGAGCPN